MQRLFQVNQPHCLRQKREHGIFLFMSSNSLFSCVPTISLVCCSQVFIFVKFPFKNLFTTENYRKNERISSIFLILYIQHVPYYYDE